jgi:outer membrane protein assembly factor BamA
LKDILVKLWGAFIPLLFTVTAWCQQDSLTSVRVPVDTLAGSVLTVGRIIILGNKVTRDRIITRELSLHPGDTISSGNLADVLIRDRSKVYNLRLFQTVVIRPVPAGTGGVDILIEVTERWYTYPQPIFELSDPNFNVWWRTYNHDFKRVNYGIRLYRNNFRGLNEYIRVMAQFGYNRRFGLLYRVPNIGRSQKHGLAFNIDYEQPKNLAFQTADHERIYLEEHKTLKTSLGLGGSYSFRRSFYETHSISVEYQNGSVIDTVRFLNPNYFTEGANKQVYTAISYSFNSEHRDVIAYPLKGYNVSGFVSKVGLGPTDNVNLLEANLTISQHYHAGQQFYLSNFTSVFASTPSSQPYSMYNAIGNRRQVLRGHESLIIESPNFFLNKTTLKKRLFSKAWSVDDSPIEQFRYFPLAVYLKVYYDFGYAQNYPRYEELMQNTMLTNKFLHGAGVGLDIVTLYDNVFRFEYTFTKTGITGFYFNLRKEF